MQELETEAAIQSAKELVARARSSNNGPDTVFYSHQANVVLLMALLREVAALRAELSPKDQPRS